MNRFFSFLCPSPEAEKDIRKRIKIMCALTGKNTYTIIETGLTKIEKEFDEGKI